jgi:hypothetical protein
LARRLDPLPEFGGTRSTIAIGRRGLDRIKLGEVGKSQALPQRYPLSVGWAQHIEALVGDKGTAVCRGHELFLQRLGPPISEFPI